MVGVEALDDGHPNKVIDEGVFLGRGEQVDNRNDLMFSKPRRRFVVKQTLNERRFS